MEPRDLAFAGLARQAELVRAGDVSSRELVELCLERIARLDPQLNSFRVVMAERALADAEQADARRSAGDERPLLGVPVAVKDNLDVTGELTTHGTGAYREPAARDAEVVRRLREAGAVIVGKTLLPELAVMGDTETLHFGVTRNPWDTTRSVGGSSGGSGAAVAAGLVPGATASDGAGSIRIPAARCGLFGLKPQRGRVSMMPDPEHWHGLSAFGFHSRRVLDTALLLDVTAGPAEGDADTPPPPPRPFAESAGTPPGRLRIAVTTRPAIPVPVAPEIHAAIEQTEGLLRSLGHEVRRDDPEWGTFGNDNVVRYFRGIHDDVERVPEPGLLQRRTRGWGRIGSLIQPWYLERVREREQRHAARINRVLEDNEVLLMPVTARPKLRAGEWEGMGSLRTFVGMARAYPYTVPWNGTGQPAAAVPTATTADGLPLGIQLVGRPNDEGTILSLAAQLEAESGWPDRRPPIS
jgi:amidase